MTTSPLLAGFTRSARLRAAVRATLAAVLVAWCMPAAAQPTTDAEFDALSAERLADISSVLSGRDAPQWHPDGSTIGAMATVLGGLDFVGFALDDGEPRLLAGDLSLVGTGSPGSQKPQFSPDGRYVAYVSSKEGPADNPSGAAGASGDDLTDGGDAPEIWLRDLQAGTDQQLTTLGSRINALRWSPDSQAILFTSDRYGSQDIWTVALESGQATRLTADPRYEVYPDWTPDGQSIVYVRMDESWEDHTVLKMSADGGAAELVVRDTNFFDYRAGLSFGTAQVSPDGEQVLFRSLRSGWHNYWVVPLEGGEPVAVATSEADQSAALWSPSGDKVVYLENHNGTVEVRTVDVQSDAARRGGSLSFGAPSVLIDPSRMAQVYGLERLSMGSAAKPAWSPDGSKVSFTYQTPVHPEDLFVVDLGPQSVTRLTQSADAAATDRLVLPEKVSFESTDGHTIHGYYHRPLGLDEGAKAPAIMWVHGGPTSQFSDNFGSHDQVHYFAQQGYAVLMPNVRGSSGYGKVFEDANNDCWGRCDLDDVRAGVEWLESRSEVDGAKRGITGTSYGGILSMAAVAFAPELFQAAIPISGYGDWVKFHDWNDELQHVKLLAYEFGPFPDSAEVYRRNSSIYSVQDVTTPVLLLHGSDDSTIPWRPAQKPVPAAVDFARALDQQYKIFRHRSYTTGSYYVYGRDNTILKLRDMGAFFDQFLRDGVIDRSDRHTAPE